MDGFPASRTRGPKPTDCHVVELRRYTLRPGRRETLIDLFDREFVETQEAQGMCLLGQFRDVDDADAFVWLRGFVDMGSRQTALSSFYGGPVWQAHKEEANATMLDVDDVLLLRPATQSHPFSDLAGSRPPIGATESPSALFTATTFSVPPRYTERALSFFVDEVDPLLTKLGSRGFGILRTENAANTFPALPVREGENAIVRLARFDSTEHYTDHGRKKADSRVWREDLGPRLSNHLDGEAVELRLRPTPRSLLR